MKTYIPTYYRLRKRESLIALGSQQGGALHFCIRGTPPRGEIGGGRFEHPRLEELLSQLR